MLFCFGRDSHSRAHQKIETYPTFKYTWQGNHEGEMLWKMAAVMLTNLLRTRLSCFKTNIQPLFPWGCTGYSVSLAPVLHCSGFSWHCASILSAFSLSFSVFSLNRLQQRSRSITQAHRQQFEFSKGQIVSCRNPCLAVWVAGHGAVGEGGVKTGSPLQLVRSNPSYSNQRWTLNEGER